MPGTPAGAPLAASAGAAAAAATASRSIRPLIFNGVVTFERPQVGLLLDRAAVGSPWLSRCTATLIGPAAALTAAHCVCPSSGGLCQPGRRDAPKADGYRLLLQHSGLLEIDSIAVPSGFSFPNQDIAVLNLRWRVAGIAPIPLAERAPTPGSVGEIVGFGSISDSSSTLGMKRIGKVRTAPCGPHLNDAQFLCWESDPALGGVNTCPGDSGAPLLIPADDGRLDLAGVASGGYGACDGDDLAFNTAVEPLRDTIAGMARGPLSPTLSGESVVQAAVAQGQLDSAVPTLALTIQVPVGTARLVLVGNAEDDGGNGHTLRLRREEPPGAADDSCISDQPGVFESCTLRDPAPGTWYAEYRRSVGLGGAVQLAATAYGGYCPVDVDGDGRFDALTDGVLVLRYLSGRSGSALTDGVVGATPWFRTAGEISAVLDSAVCTRDLDLDGNGVREAQTDGRLLLRHLFGFHGATLTQGAVASGATRSTAEEIGAWIEGLKR